jgi:nucleoside 2-deoxyribosyltransferase
MQKAYLSISYQNRKNLQPEIAIIQKLLADFPIELFIFVDNYLFSATEEKQMMQKAFDEIESSDLLIAEVSEKAIGVGIEIGYAVAKNTPVIYLRNASAEHSTTAAGSAKHIIIYNDLQGLAAKFSEVLGTFKM